MVGWKKPICPFKWMRVSTSLALEACVHTKTPTLAHSPCFCRLSLTGLLSCSLIRLEGLLECFKTLQTTWGGIMKLRQTLSTANGHICTTL
jgi:hypothetical protein